MTQSQTSPSVCILIWCSFIGMFCDFLGGVTQTLGASCRGKFQHSERDETIMVNQSVRIPSCT